MSFWNFVENEDSNEEVELRIEGDITMDDDFWAGLFGIETVTPKGFRQQLAEHKGKNITVWINSSGGNVIAASQIYTALKEHKGNVAVKVDGMAMSAASVIAMAGSETLMSPTSIMMIHNPWVGARGEAKDMRHVADILDEVKETIVNAYQLKTGRSRSKIAKMMDDETWMSAKKALSEGFIDGMLYADIPPEEVPVENSFMFGRMSIQNNAADSMKRFIDTYTEKLREMEKRKHPQETHSKSSNQVPLPPDPAVTRQAPVDIYQKQIQINRRKANV